LTPAPYSCGGRRSELGASTVTADTEIIAHVSSEREFRRLIGGAPHLAKTLLVGLVRRLRTTGDVVNNRPTTSEATERGRVRASTWSPQTSTSSSAPSGQRLSAGGVR